MANQVSYRTDEVYVIVDSDTRQLRQDDRVLLDVDEAWERSRDYENAIPITLEQYFKEIE